MEMVTIRIGYACINLSIDAVTSKGCLLRNATPQRLRELIGMNLAGLRKILEYNAKKGIRLFRISSDLIPFGSHEVNNLEWHREFEEELDIIARIIEREGMRVSMHPGQYTVLNSNREEVVRSAVRELEYHARVLDSITSTHEHKMVLHIGGVYGDKKAAAGRFVENYGGLPDSVKRRLVIENDEKNYNSCEVLKISYATGAPVIFDNLHNAINPCGEGEATLVRECAKTWKSIDGLPKLHYSQQDRGKRSGAHSQTIESAPFFKFIEGMGGLDADIMLEVKDKNISAERMMALLGGSRAELQREWARYKYAVMEKSYAAYKEIGVAVAKGETGAAEIFGMVNSALDVEPSAGEAACAAEHVWGYFKKQAGTDEKEAFKSLIEGFRGGEISLKEVKIFLSELRGKYPAPYLSDSYYFNT
ncbi:UV DNA damage endonuclease UvsE [Peptoclostridium acidaminophilum DSM 3953]|uniref:UV DNA damage endonuclease UvsE n=1 Tax=Peptoclostridium acidaminophilum DSM 3953 TaxID=1286171 RepID=W8T6N5_PEPAC|nr:UV DNA damage repair endonuclease UvsE [Peptoclostridium acidaminophilum]AHM57409.1 UV DNA damage endonuclease UvsE [Peptoclostridium acidaminophilum DSM 3953]